MSGVMRTPNLRLRSGGRFLIWTPSKGMSGRSDGSAGGNDRPGPSIIGKRGRRLEGREHKLAHWSSDAYEARADQALALGDGTMVRGKVEII